MYIPTGWPEPALEVGQRQLIPEQRQELLPDFRFSNHDRIQSARTTRGRLGTTLSIEPFSLLGTGRDRGVREVPRSSESVAVRSPKHGVRAMVYQRPVHYGGHGANINLQT